MYKIRVFIYMLFFLVPFVTGAEQFRSTGVNKIEPVIEKQEDVKKYEKTDSKNTDIQNSKEKTDNKKLQISKKLTVEPILTIDAISDKQKKSETKKYETKKEETTKEKTAKVVTSQINTVVIPEFDEIDDDVIINHGASDTDEVDEYEYEDDVYFIDYTNNKKTKSTTVNWKNKKIKAPITTDKLDKQDISKKGIFVQGRSADGECDIYKDGARKFKHALSWCDDLRKGEWNVRFDYGVVHGKSVCAMNKGTFSKIGNPIGSGGQYCWCRVLKYGGKEVETSYWVFGEDIGSASGCSRYCSFGCATGIQLNKDFRKTMFGVQ